jgi:hypothetical protein
MRTKTTNPDKPVKKTAAQAQSEAMGRYTAKKATEKSMAAGVAKAQSEATARTEAKKIAKAGSYKTNAKGQLVLSDGRVVNYKGGVTPQKLKSANVKVTPPSKFGMNKGKK